MSNFLGAKRLSIWLLLLSLAFAASMMHPGFATMIALTMLLVLMLAMRFIAHFEGQYMLKEAEARGRTVRGPLARELAIGVGIAVVLIFGLFWITVHMPWFWFPSSN